LIVKDALESLDREKIELSKEMRQKLTKDLIIVVCSDIGRP